MSRSNHITAVLFDLDGTLRHNRPGGFETLVEYAEELGRTFTLEQLPHGERWTHYSWAPPAEYRAGLQEFGGENAAFGLRQPDRQLRALEAPDDLTELAVNI